jgi:hypothetical protein
VFAGAGGKLVQGRSNWIAYSEGSGDEAEVWFGGCVGEIWEVDMEEVRKEEEEGEEETEGML